MQVDLHLISWNRPKMTELVIRAIHRNTHRKNFRLIVLDNGSETSTQEMLEDLRDEGLIDDLIMLKTNLGLEPARQLLFREATISEYFVCVDNDCIPPPIEDGIDWLEKSIQLMEQYEDYAAIALRTQVMVGTGNIFEEADDKGYDIIDFPHPGGSFRIMRTNLVFFVNGWDRQSAGRGQEERFIGEKLRNAGFKTAFAVNLRCLHLFGLRGDNPTDRWGYDKDLKPEETGHSDISHPALINGDDLEEVALYAGWELADDYSSN